MKVKLWSIAFLVVGLFLGLFASSAVIAVPTNNLDCPEKLFAAQGNGEWILHLAEIRYPPTGQLRLACIYNFEIRRRTAVPTETPYPVERWIPPETSGATLVTTEVPENSH